jgi:hypothetical protein
MTVFGLCWSSTGLLCRLHNSVLSCRGGGAAASAELQVVQEAVHQRSLLPQHHRAAQLVRHVGMRIAQVGACVRIPTAFICSSECAWDVSQA